MKNKDQQPPMTDPKPEQPASAVDSQSPSTTYFKWADPLPGGPLPPATKETTGFVA